MGSHSGRVHNRVSSAPRKLRHLQGKHASRIGFPPSPHATTQPQSRVHTKRMTGQNKYAVQVNFAHVFYIGNCPFYLYLRLRFFFLLKHAKGLLSRLPETCYMWWGKTVQVVTCCIHLYFYRVGYNPIILAT